MHTATMPLSRLDGPSVNPLTARQWSQFADEEMLTRCQRGEKRALEALLKRFERPIFALAYRLSGNYDDTNDIAATTFLRICQTIHSCKSAITLPAWVNRIVTNVFYDMCRRSQRHQAASLDEMMERTSKATLPFAETEDKSPLAYVNQQEQKAIVDRAIAALPEAQRQLVQMFYQEERTYEEISAETGLPVGTIKSRLNRARNTLQRRLLPHHAAMAL
jgi:RNA polymerase sigma-70 factor (ECF subfamily)